jgi:hypothetical protein
LSLSWNAETIASLKSRSGIREGCGTLYRKMSNGRNLPIEQPHNLAVPARELLNGDFVFYITCEFNNLRVVKMARLATPARLGCRPVFSGMVCINFSRPKKSVANEANLFCVVGQDIFVSALFDGQ